MAVNIRRPRSGTHPMDAARIKSLRVRRSLRPRWGSHRENATGALGASQDDVSGFFAHEEADKARALSAWTLTRSRAVRALSAVPVLCPFLPERSDQNQLLS